MCDHAHALHYMCTSCIIYYGGWKAKRTGLYPGTRADYEVHGITHADTGFTQRRVEKGMHAMMHPLCLDCSVLHSIVRVRIYSVLHSVSDTSTYRARPVDRLVYGRT